MFEIKVKLMTNSNCLIGNQTESFSVGGVDQSTTIDENKKPIIHGSSFKGAFRNIVREKDADMPATKEYVKLVLKKVIEKYQVIPKTEKINKMLLKIQDKCEDPRAEYIFGMEGLNDMPRLFCSDFRFSQEDNNDIDNCFLIETKNSLEEKDGNIESNPRTYKVVKAGVVFIGKIRLHNTLLELESSKLKGVKEELIKALKEFNTGFYGIGNSKSRGYGYVTIEIID